MANVKTNLFDLNSYDPAVKTINRPKTTEYVNSPEMTELANLSTRVNSKMLHAFECDPENDDMKKVVLFASLTQGISAVTKESISPFSDIGGDEETYCKYLDMLATIAEIIFGSESEFSKAVNSVINAEPRNSLSVLVGINTAIDKMYDKILEEVDNEAE